MTDELQNLQDRIDSLKEEANVQRVWLDILEEKMALAEKMLAFLRDKQRNEASIDH